MDNAARQCVMCHGENVSEIQCGHSLCEGCVKALMTSEKNNQLIHPPCCHMASYVPRFDPVEIETPKCANHQDVDGFQECLTCKVSFCPPCVTIHQTPAYANHALAEIGTIAKQAEHQAQSMCGLHGELLNLYCTACEKLVCSLCDRGAHREHTCQPAVDILETSLRDANLQTFFSDSEAEITRLRTLLIEAKERLEVGERAVLQHCREALEAFEARVKADTAGKLDDINKRLNALTALQQRVKGGEALLAAGGNIAEQFKLLDFAKKLARALTTALVYVPQPLRVQEGGIAIPLPVVNEGTEAYHYANIFGAENLCPIDVHGPDFQNVADSQYRFTPADRSVQLSDSPSSLRLLNAREGYSEGVHHWSLRFMFHHYIAVGLKIPSRSDTLSTYWQDVSYVLAEDGCLFSSLRGKDKKRKWRSGTPYCPEIPSGVANEVELQLDMKKRTLSFSINGHDHGIAFDKLPDGPLYPAVVLVDVGDWAKFVSYKKRVPVEDCIKPEISFTASGQ